MSVRISSPAGSSLTIGTTTISGLTAGSVLFGGTAGVIQQDNANFFWDDTNNRLGIGTASPASALYVKGTGTVQNITESTSTNGRAIVQVYDSNAGGTGVFQDYRAYGSAFSETLFGTALANSTVNFANPQAVGHIIGVVTNFSLIFGTNSTERGRFTAAGNFGVGTGSTVSAKVHIGGGTEQLRIGYDTSNYVSETVSSTGGITYDAVGSGASFTWLDSINLPYVAKTSTYTATTNDYTIDCTSGTFTVNLPAVSGLTGRIYVIKNTGTGVITADGNASETIDGATTYTLNTQYQSITLQCTGVAWIII